MGKRFSRAWRGAEKLYRRLAGNVGLFRNLFDNEALWTDSNKTQIAIMLRGGVGDVMIAARWLNNVIPLLATGADVVIDIYYALPENIVFIFGNFPQIRYLYGDVAFERVREYYDFSFVINHLGYIEIDSGEMDAKLAELPFASVVQSWSPGLERFSRFTTRDYHPDLGKNFYSLIQQGHFMRHSILEAQTGVGAPVAPFPFALPGEEELKELPQLRDKFITVHDGWDAQLRMGDRRPTKTYPTEKWSALVTAIKARFPDLAIVQIGGATGAPIPGADLNLKSAISFGSSARVLQRAMLHVDTDSGLVHVAASLGTKSIVLFGPTDVHYYGYPANINLNAEGCNNCWLSTGSWAASCMLGDPVPSCMQGIKVGRIVRAVGAALDEMRVDERLDAVDCNGAHDLGGP